MSSNYVTPPNRSLVHLSRPHDFLYDPNYTMPSREDFLKDAAFGIKSGARVTLRPIYQNFFSALDTARRIQPCLTIPQPSNIDTFMPQYDICGIPVMPMDTGPLPLPRLVDDVTGADRAKYAIRYGSNSYQMHAEPFDFNKLPPEEKKKILQTERTQRSGYMSRGIQTDMRESETQTDPYSPPYKLTDPESYPKVLALAHLTWGKGLPFTLDDIVVIERALAKRILDHTDRVAEDKEAFESRIKLTEELETQQWADRERELERILRTKQELTDRLLADYNAKVAADHTLRLEQLQAMLQARNSERLKAIKHQYFRSLRQLEKKYLEEKPPLHRNIIKDYIEFDSSIYASLVRNGPHMDLLNPAPDFQFDLHRDIEAFQQLTESKSFIKGEVAFDMEAFKDRIKACEPSTAEQRLERKLEKIYMAFKDWNVPKKVDVNKDIAESHRGSTQFITLEGENDEGRRRPHCITLQKIARGRTIQKMIRTEIYENMNELLGMKQMFDMDPNCLRVEESQFQKLLALKKQAEAEAAKDPEVKEVIGNLEGETLNKMLEFLDKEMIRLIDERKIHALILMAERERRRKEAMEAGRRFVEEENRRTNDEIFRQVVGIHQATVDLYLEDIYIESADRAADEAARVHVRQMAATLNEAAYAMHSDLGDYEKEEIAAEIVAGYIVPELSRLSHQERLDAAQKRYKKAAGQVVSSLFGAQELLKQIEDGPLPPLIEAHNLIGWAATDGSLQVVDDFIKQAVVGVIKAEDEAAAAAAALRLVEAESARILAEEEEAAELERELEDDERQIERPSLFPGGDADDDLDQVIEDWAEGGMVEVAPGDDDIETPDEELERMFEDPTIVDTDYFKSKFAAKALQIELELEPCQHVERLYAGLTGAVNNLILEARRTVVPDPPEELVVKEDDEDTDDD